MTMRPLAAARCWICRRAAALATAMVALAALGVCEKPSSAQAGRRIDVRSYVVRIAPDLRARTVAGSVSIEFVATTDLSRVSFDSANLTVDAATNGGRPLRFTQADRRVTLDLGTRLASGRSATVALRYHGTPTRGVTFIDQPQQVYTVFATSEWMVCIDDPSDKATLDLTIAAPSDWTVISHGNAVNNAGEEPGIRAHRFVLASPAPSYTYGFAAGRFAAVVHDRIGDVDLQYVSAGTDENTIRRVFADTPDMLRFFEHRAGVPYAGHTFTQVLTAGDAQQELSGLVLLPRTYAPWVAEHPRDITLAAHELAHQWWGNRVTCESWNEFWLNEGMATFMAAAYVEHRLGRDAYDRLIAGYRADYERIRDTGHDKPLVFAEWSHPTRDDRTLVYRKGAYVLALLRETVGDEAFWAGLRAYTRQFDGESVDSADLRAHMQRASGRNLAEFFSRWVSLR